MARCARCGTDVPGAGRHCDACHAAMALEQVLRRASGWIPGRISAMANLISAGYLMSDVAPNLGVSRARLYEVIDNYGLKDLVDICREIGKLFRQGKADTEAYKELLVTREHLIASAIKTNSEETD